MEEKIFTACDPSPSLFFIYNELDSELSHYIKKKSKLTNARHKNKYLTLHSETAALLL